jgi:hypothetical protein
VRATTPMEIHIMNSSRTGLLALATAAIATAGCGSSKDHDAKPADAGQTRVAQLVNRLGVDARSGDTKAICSELFTKNLRASITKAAGTSCATEVGRNIAGSDVRFSVVQVDARDDQAVALVKDQKGRRSSLVILPESGVWKIARIGSAADVSGLGGS